MFTTNFFYYITLAIYCFGYYLAAGLAINIAYHRCLSHRSFKLRKPLERIFVTLGLPAGTPIQWAGSHRFHHQYADEERDPHSPVRDGFWHAHVGWYKHPLVPLPTTGAGYRLLLHGLASESLHAILREHKRKQNE